MKQMLRSSSLLLRDALFFSRTRSLFSSAAASAADHSLDVSSSDIDASLSSSSSSSSSSASPDDKDALLLSTAREYQDRAQQAAGSQLISELEKNSIATVALSIGPEERYYKDISNKFIDQRDKRCLLCGGDSMLDSFGGLKTHMNMPQHQAREAIALEMLRKNRGTPAQVVARWWHLLDDAHGGPIDFYRQRSLMAPAPGVPNPATSDVYNDSNNAAADDQQHHHHHHVGHHRSFSSSPFILQTDTNNHLARRRTTALHFGVSPVVPRDIAFAVEKRRARLIAVVKFLRDAGSLHEFQGAFDEKFCTLGRTAGSERLEWIGDNYGKISVYNTLLHVFPAEEGGLRGRLGLVSSLLDSNEGLARAFDWMGAKELFPELEVVAKPKWRADCIESLRGELWTYAESSVLRWGGTDVAGYEAPAHLSRQMLQSVARHALTDLDHFILIANFVQVLRVVLSLLQKNNWAIDESKTSPFYPVAFDADTFRVRSLKPTDTQIAERKAVLAEKRKKQAEVERIKRMQSQQRLRIYSLKNLSKTPRAPAQDVAAVASSSSSSCAAAVVRISREYELSAFAERASSSSSCSSSFHRRMPSSKTIVGGNISISSWSSSSSSSTLSSLLAADYYLSKLSPTPVAAVSAAATPSPAPQRLAVPPQERQLSPQEFVSRVLSQRDSAHHFCAHLKSSEPWSSSVSTSLLDLHPNRVPDVRTCLPELASVPQPESDDAAAACPPAESTSSSNLLLQHFMSKMLSSSSSAPDEGHGERHVHEAVCAAACASQFAGEGAFTLMSPAPASARLGCDVDDILANLKYVVKWNLE